MIKVFHAVPDFFPDSIMYPIRSSLESIAKNFKKKYQQVAFVDTWDLEEAFRLTNSEFSAWNDVRRGSKVDPVGEANHRARSTSVGDVLVREGYPEAFVVGACGFDKIDLSIQWRKV